MDADAAEVASRNVSRETRSKLDILVELVRKWSPHINLVAPSTISSIWTRHVLDSLQLYDLAPISAGRWLDLGSGAGFPGAVIALVASERAPAVRVTLVESDQRKATFLRTVSRETECPFDVISTRIEEVAPLNAAVVSARALAPLNTLIGYAHRHLAKDGVAVFPKGARHASELPAAEATWSFDREACASSTDPNAAIYLIRKVQRVR